MIAQYPEFSEIIPDQRAELHPLFQSLVDGISEFTFAGLYLFRTLHHYRISRLPDGGLVVVGKERRNLATTGGELDPFFMLPFGIPGPDLLAAVFDRFECAKAVSESQSELLASHGYHIEEDRDNFDYLYSREEMASLAGRKFHRKKNLLNVFVRNYRADAKPLLEEYVAQALDVLEAWRGGRDSDDPGDYAAAREALERMEELQLCGGIYYIDGRPVAYSLGEEIARGKTFAIHFEKAVRPSDYKGIYQYMNNAFAAILPEKYESINREQDLGHLGLRQAKESYSPSGFIRKFRACRSVSRP